MYVVRGCAKAGVVFLQDAVRISMLVRRVRSLTKIPRKAAASVGTRFSLELYRGLHDELCSGSIRISIVPSTQLLCSNGVPIGSEPTVCWMRYANFAREMAEMGIYY